MKLTAVALVTFFGTAGVPDAAASCHIPSGRVVASDRVARLIAVPTPYGSGLYACLRRSGRKIPLDIGATKPRLAGRWVAWQRREGGDWRIVVHDLRSGRERLVIGHVAGDALFLTTSGTAVWAQRLDPDVGVFANDLRTGGHLLGRGEIDPASLRLDWRRVSWWANGKDYYTADVA